jgi:anti-anti-sigma factor
MIMGATERRLGTVVILDISLSVKKRLLREVDATVSELLESGEKSILMNFQELTFFDASCLAFIVSSYLAAKDADGQIKFVIPNPRPKEALRICGLGMVIDCFDNEADAIACFAS